MKRLKMSLMAMVVFCSALALTTLTAQANDHKAAGKNKQKTVTFIEDVLVNDQLVKQGTYRVKFNAASSQITIHDNDGDVVATARAFVKMGERKALYNSIASEQTPKGKVMTALTFEGDQRIITLEEPANQTADGQGQ